MTEPYLAATNPEWRHPADHVPPLGTKLLLLTRGGVCVIGNWDVETGCVAWAPLPKVSPELRARLDAEAASV